MRRRVRDLLAAVPAWAAALALAMLFIAWPQAASAAGAMAPAAIALLLVLGIAYVVRAMRRPHDYRSIEVHADGFVVEPLAGRPVAVAWRDVRALEFCRSRAIFHPGIDTEWVFDMGEDVRVRVLVEGADRRRFPEALIAHLPGIDASATRALARTREPGRWPCWSRAHADALPSIR